MWGAAQRKAVSLATVWLQEPIAAADYRAEAELRAEVVRLEYSVSKLRLEEKRSVDNAARDASRMASLKKTADKLRSELTQQQRLGECLAEYLRSDPAVLDGRLQLQQIARGFLPVSAFSGFGTNSA